MVSIINHMAAVSQQLVLKGVQVSSVGIRVMWISHKILGRHQRLIRLETKTQKTKLKLTDE